MNHEPYNVWVTLQGFRISSCNENGALFWVGVIFHEPWALTINLIRHLENRHKFGGNVTMFLANFGVDSYPKHPAKQIVKGPRCRLKHQQVLTNKGTVESG